MSHLYRIRRTYNRAFKRSTREAWALRKALERRDIRVLTEVWDGHKHIDLAIPDAYMNIEVDGMQHLTNARQILSDLARGHYSNELGYQTIHIHNSELHHHLDDIADALAAAARERMHRNEADSKKSDSRV